MPRRGHARAALLAAAERVFAEGGLAGARTEQIAAAAGVNKALLHYYFESKENLHQAVLENLLEQFSASVREPLADRRHPRAALFTYVERHFAFLRAHPNYPALLQRHLMTGGPGLRSVVARYLRPLYRRLGELLRAGIRRREFRTVDIDNTVVSLIALTVFYFAAAPVLSQIFERDIYEPRRVAARQQAVMDFIRHGLLRKPD